MNMGFGAIKIISDFHSHKDIWVIRKILLSFCVWVMERKCDGEC